MPDIVDPATRSRMMSGIRSKNTRPELRIRKALHALGFRYRIHAAHVPGKPDMIFPRYRAAIFVHGCFWHGHDCRLFKLPGTRPEFWSRKIERNRARDAIVAGQLAAKGWRSLTIWECAIRGPCQLGISGTVAQVADWLTGASPVAEIRGAARCPSILTSP